MGSAIHGLVVLGTIRQQEEQSRGNKPVSSTLPCPLLQLQIYLSSSRGFFHLWIAMWKYKLNKPFSYTTCFLVTVLYCSNKNPKTISKFSFVAWFLSFRIIDVELHYFLLVFSFFQPISFLQSLPFPLNMIATFSLIFCCNTEHIHVCVPAQIHKYKLLSPFLFFCEQNQWSSWQDICITCSW